MLESVSNSIAHVSQLRVKSIKYPYPEPFTVFLCLKALLLWLLLAIVVRQPFLTICWYNLFIDNPCSICWSQIFCYSSSVTDLLVWIFVRQPYLINQVQLFIFELNEVLCSFTIFESNSLGFLNTRHASSNLNFFVSELLKSSVTNLTLIRKNVTFWRQATITSQNECFLTCHSEFVSRHRFWICSSTQGCDSMNARVQIEWLSDIKDLLLARFFSWS